MIEMLANTQVQMLLLCLIAIGCFTSFMVGYRLGHREGYDDGVRTLAKTMILNNVRVKIENEDKL